MNIAVVAIGRNEGDRLIGCLDALAQSGMKPERVVYVDSGSTDGSVNAARASGAEVVLLDTSLPFTAARARNAGRQALQAGNNPEFIQFIDGDCAINPTWLEKAHSFLEQNPKVAVVCGRRRERFPATSVYNQQCDFEWNTPIGKTRSCGGDALMRVAALDQVGGYNAALIAGEEPEMCVRMRQQGWEIWRIDEEMTLHDAAMTRFGQFWKRACRGGHAYTEGASIHGAPPERHGVKGRNSALLWGFAFPLMTLGAYAVCGPIALVAIAIYPLQVLRLAKKRGLNKISCIWALLIVVGKFAEAQGALSFLFDRLMGRRAGLIEYK